MAQTLTTCPRCQHQMTANIQQIFDLHEDPRQGKTSDRPGKYGCCPSCGYQSAIGVLWFIMIPKKNYFDLLSFRTRAADQRTREILGPVD